MSIIQSVRDHKNEFLSRREITCDFKGLGGNLLKKKAVEMVTAELALGDKLVIPIRLRNHVGKTTVTGTFYVYDDEKLARKHVNPTIFARLERGNKEDGQ